jgi:hypothetical protein
MDPTALSPGTGYDGVPVNPGYALNQIKTGVYFFSRRGAFRTDNVFSTDLTVRYDVPYRGLRMFLKGAVSNVFNRAAVDSPDREVITRTNGGASSGLRAFNPFRETPIEGVHYRLSPSFGKPTGPESYQTPRTYQISLGVHL